MSSLDVDIKGIVADAVTPLQVCSYYLLSSAARHKREPKGGCWGVSVDRLDAYPVGTLVHTPKYLATSNIKTAVGDRI